ncbi:MAG: site-specific DNA-methyltransferase [Patescibacteria group bacterium]|jgi:adenine-specific DNA-methyltransferase
MKNAERTPEDNQRAQLENELARLNKKIAKYEAIELKQNRFGLVWLDVPEAFEDDVENKLPILEEVPKLAINSKDDKPTHLLIEGDNYHALTCLNYTHKGKVDVIYIDPPYNTGIDGFKYKDKRILKEYPDGTEVPVEHPLRHSYWLSFMKKRLELSKDLLKEDGVIFISIDDNEIGQLKLLCDEIFYSENFIDIFSWVRTETPARLSKKSLKVVEYVLCYQKTNKLKGLKGFKSSSETSNTLLNQTNTFKTLIFPANVVETGIADGKIKKGKYGTASYKIILEEDTEVKGGIFTKPIKLKAKFRWSQEKLNEEIKNGTIISIRTETFSPGYEKKEYETGAPKNLIDRNVGVFTNETAKKEMQDLGIDFSYPKPTSLIKYLCNSVDNKNAVILDFFAGSGTTGDAVMKLNQDDDGKRQFILVTNNDEITNGKKHRIMTDICYPRIKKIIKGYNSKKGLDNSIRYFKTAFVGKNNILKADDADKIELAHNAGGMLAIAENTFDQVAQNDYWQIFENKKQYTAVYFREEFGKFDDFLEKVRKLKKPAVVYIFSWEKEFEFNEFEDDKNIKVKTIPQPILEIYKQIYNLV